MASELQRVAQGLVECLDQMPQVVAYLQRLAQKCRDNAMHIADFHSAQPVSRNVALMLDEAARRCEEAADLGARSHARARTWAAQMVGGTAAVTPTAPAEGITMGPRTADSGTVASLAQTGDAAAATLERLPKRAKGSGEKTRGIWRDDTGQEHDLVSGIDRYTQLVDAISKHLKIGRPPHLLALGTHVEVKFAAMMRRRGLRDATIVINNVPCNGQASCDELLERFLPPGVNLTIYGSDGFKKTYQGKADLQ